MEILLIPIILFIVLGYTIKSNNRQKQINDLEEKVIEMSDKDE